MILESNSGKWFEWNEINAFPGPDSKQVIQNNDCLFQDLLMVPFLSFRQILLPCLPYQSWKTKHTHHDAKFQPDIQCIFHLTRMVSCFLYENFTNEKCSLKLNLKIKRVLRVHKLVWSSKVSGLACPPISVSSEHISMFFRVYLEESGEKRGKRREKMVRRLQECRQSAVVYSCIKTAPMKNAVSLA